MTDKPREAMTWRYAMTREFDELGDDLFTIREVYTGENGSLSWTENAISARGEKWMECVNDLAMMGRAVGGPILDLTLDPPAFVDPRTMRRALGWLEADKAEAVPPPTPPPNLRDLSNDELLEELRYRMLGHSVT